jgi:hypothetical protein
MRQRLCPERTVQGLLDPLAVTVRALDVVRAVRVIDIYVRIRNPALAIARLTDFAHIQHLPQRVDGQDKLHDSRVCLESENNYGITLHAARHKSWITNYNSIAVRTSLARYRQKNFMRKRLSIRGSFIYYPGRMNQ